MRSLGASVGKIKEWGVGDREGRRGERKNIYLIKGVVKSDIMLGTVSGIW